MTMPKTSNTALLPRQRVGCVLLLLLAVLSHANDTDQTCPAGDHSCSTQARWGKVQNVKGDEAAKTQAIVDKTIAYMLDTVMIEAKYADVRSECQNRHENCAFWATIGECEANPDYMTMQCAPSCQTCEKLSFEYRCPYDKEAPTVFTEDGDLNNMFEKMITFEEYQPKIYFKPHPNQTEIEEHQIKEGPWVVVLEDFLTNEECDRLIELGNITGYKRSEDVGEKKFDGSFESKQSTDRTSENAWCQDECYDDPVVKSVHDKMVHITGIPAINYEFLQMLKYTEGQFYKTHHDYIGHHTERASGVRILTFFLYLNDVEQGGGTNFPRLDNLIVNPKRGRALVWPSVLDEDPNSWDRRTHHGALAVEKGIKYGTNAWIHQRDFKTPYASACH